MRAEESAEPSINLLKQAFKDINLIKLLLNNTLAKIEINYYGDEEASELHQNACRSWHKLEKILSELILDIRIQALREQPKGIKAPEITLDNFEYEAFVWPPQIYIAPAKAEESR